MDFFSTICFLFQQASNYIPYRFTSRCHISTDQSMTSLQNLKALKGSELQNENARLPDMTLHRMSVDVSIPQDKNQTNI